MATPAQRPPLMTDPLNMGTPDAAAEAASRQEQDEIERQQKVMEQGMPARNLKKVGIVALALAAGAYMLYPTLFPKKPVQQAQVQQTTDKAAAGNIVEQLKSQLPNRPAPSASEPAVARNSPAPPQSVTTDPGDRPVTLRELEASRREAITASGMEPADISLKQKDAGNASRQMDELKTSETAILKSKNEALEKALQAIGQPGNAGASSQQSSLRKSQEDEFVLSTRSAKLEDPTLLAPARSKSALYQGTIIQVVLDRSINTDNPGVARGRVRSDVYDSVNQQVLLIPRGSVVLLPYLNSVLVGQSRILLAGERLIFPNGKSFALSGTVASDMQGASGLPAEIDNHFFEMFRTSLIIGASSLLLPKDQQQVTLTESASGSKSTSGGILGTALYDIIQRVSARNVTIKPTASIDAGEPFTLMLSRDVELEPYVGRK